MKNITLSANEKLTLIGNLATLLSAGIPIMEAVDSILADSKGSAKIVLTALKSDLAQGLPISATFAKFPKSFDPVIVNLVKAAEEAGNLETTLKDLTVTIEKDIEFAGKIKAALVYPVLVVIVFMAVILVILTFVVPRIASVFTKLKITLPLATKILIATSNIFLSYTPFIIVGFLTLAVGLILLYKTKKKLFVRFLTSLPLMSKLARQIDLTRFTRSMALLLTSGIPITEAIALSAEVIYKKEIAKIVENCQQGVAAGKKFSEGLKTNKKIIPPMMILVSEAGERSGTLEKSMTDLAVHFDNQVADSLKTLATLFEPILLIIVGLLVGGVMLAIISPIYGLIGQISPRAGF